MIEFCGDFINPTYLEYIKVSDEDVLLKFQDGEEVEYGFDTPEEAAAEAKSLASRINQACSR